jgi:hypothetical protein
LKTIDCVAKCDTDTDPGEYLLLQITLASQHRINATYLNEILRWLKPQRFMTVVPNEDICNNFRLTPSTLDTDVPLYLDDAFFEKPRAD